MTQVMLLMFETERGASLGTELGILLCFYYFIRSLEIVIRLLLSFN